LKPEFFPFFTIVGAFRTPHLIFPFRLPAITSSW
jgi:hypothetical protein